MSDGFLIKKISICNFRGYSDQHFTFFDEKKSKFGLILLGGPNGYGKTSLIDALEWCLTGTITRLKEDYDVRNEKKNAKIKKCLIRHNGDRGEVSVTLEGSYQNKTILLERMFSDKDESKAFYPENSKFIVNQIEIHENKTIDYVIKQPIAKDFYERFTCSYEKNIRVYEKSRTNIYEMFSSFFGGTKEIETIINNLDGVNKGKSDRKSGLIERLEKDITIHSKLNYEKSKDKYEEAVSKLSVLLDEKNDTNILSLLFASYPAPSFFYGEISPVRVLKEEGSFQNKINKLRLQLNKFKRLHYLKTKSGAYDQSFTYIGDMQAEKTYHEFIEQIWDPYNLLEKEILSIQKKNIDNLKDNKKVYEGLKAELNNYSDVSKDGAVKLKEVNSKLFGKENENVRTLIELDLLYVSRESYSNQLEGFKTPDESLNALRSLIDHKQGFINHREKGHKNCPLCGSDDSFSKEDTDLAKIAIDILGKIDEQRANLQQKYNSCYSDIERIYKKVLINLMDELTKRAEVSVQLIRSFRRTEAFRASCKAFSLDVATLDRQQIEKKKAELEEQRKRKETLLELEKYILNVLSNQENELEGIRDEVKVNKWLKKQLFIEGSIDTKVKYINQFIHFYKERKKESSEEMELGDISMEDLQEKIRLLGQVLIELESQSAIENATIEMNRLEKIFKENAAVYEKQDEKLSQLKNMSVSLKMLRKQWDKDMVEEIKIPLRKIYKRINRHTNIKDIDLLVEGKTNTMASLMATINNEEVSATNILSAGQLSVVALAIFITVAMGQKQSPFKCYFMDDPIQTMDDLNILSFIDLLRTELSSDLVEGNRFADQLFFTTCDENLERLMTHKMKSFGVNYTHFHFTGYGEYIVKS
ncbi:hypothetical protein ABEP16_21510 [Priestia aryabhattai]|uniref:hypothetical protein n=1 Tax=Priestia aryabhattai TaxID=412384 RepID=UPI003D2D0E22